MDARAAAPTPLKRKAAGSVGDDRSDDCKAAAIDPAAADTRATLYGGAAIADRRASLGMARGMLAPDAPLAPPPPPPPPLVMQCMPPQMAMYAMPPEVYQAQAAWLAAMASRPSPLHLGLTSVPYFDLRQLPGSMALFGGAPSSSTMPMLMFPPQAYPPAGAPREQGVTASVPPPPPVVHHDNPEDVVADDGSTNDDEDESVSVSEAAGGDADGDGDGTPQRRFACRFCDYRATKLSVLETHVRRHTGEKPFSCKFCGFKARQMSSVIRHERRHTNDRPYACHLCDYRAYQQSHLRVHLAKHTGIKPYSCK